jgi:hypothetical protein
MMLEDLIDKLADMIEAERPDLAGGLRKTSDMRRGTFDGHLVLQLENIILADLSRFPDQDKIEAYNEIADAEGLSRLGEKDQDIDYWIYQSFIDPVLFRLMKTNLQGNLPKVNQKKPRAAFNE